MLRTEERRGYVWGGRKRRTCNPACFGARKSRGRKTGTKGNINERTITYRGSSSNANGEGREDPNK
jgi:hypothetical protein